MFCGKKACNLLQEPTGQTYFTTANEQVSADSAVRLMDTFIDKFDLKKVGCTNEVLGQQTITAIPR